MSMGSEEMPKHKIYELVTADVLSKLGSASVQHDKQVKCIGSDRTRQVDVLIEGKVAGMPIKIIVDCKYYGKKLDVKDVDAFISLTEDIKPNMGILVSPKGFTSGAIERAGKYGNQISLCSIFNEEHLEYSTPIGLDLYRIVRPGLKMRIQMINGPEPGRFPLPPEHLLEIEHIAGIRYNIRDFVSYIIGSDPQWIKVKSGTVSINTNEYKLVDGNSLSRLAKLEVEFKSDLSVEKRRIEYSKGSAILNEKGDIISSTSLATDFIDAEEGWKPVSKKEAAEVLQNYTVGLFGVIPHKAKYFRVKRD